MSTPDTLDRDTTTLLVPYRIKLKNFMSYHGTHHHDIERGLGVILGVDFDTKPPGNNGAGKSAIFYAITWCLFGRLPLEGFLVDDVINWEADDCEVKVKFTAHGTNLTVCRTRNVNGTGDFWFKVNGEKFKGDKKATQSTLEEFLHIDWNLYNTTVLIAAGTKVSNFYAANATERMNTLANIIDDQWCKDTAQLVKQDIYARERERSNKESEASVYQRQVDHSQTQLETLRQNMKAEAEKVAKLENTMRQDVVSIETEVLRTQDLLRAGPEGDVSETQSALGEVSAQLNTLRAHSGKLDYLIKSTPNLMQGTCPTCTQPITADHINHLQAATAQHRTELVQVQRQIQLLEQRKQALTEEYHKHQQWPVQKKNLEDKINVLKLQAYTAREGINNSLMQQYSNQVSQLEGTIDGFQWELAQLNNRMLELDGEINSRKICYEGFSRGIRYMLVDDVREIMSYYSNRDLQMLGKPDQSLEFKSETNSGKDSFLIEPLYQGDRHGLLSKGQAYRVSLAVTLGLIKTIHHYRPHRLGFMLVDDPVGELDDRGCRDVGSLLEDLTRQIPTIRITAPRNVDFGDHPTIIVHHEKGRSVIQQ